MPDSMEGVRCGTNAAYFFHRGECDLIVVLFQLLYHVGTYFSSKMAIENNDCSSYFFVMNGYCMDVC